VCFGACCPVRNTLSLHLIRRRQHRWNDRGHRQCFPATMPAPWDPSSVRESEVAVIVPRAGL
jgi:hypothetical protein